MVAVTDGDVIMEVITRAQTDLAVILVVGTTSTSTSDYVASKNHFQEAAEKGLIKIVQVHAD